VEKSNREIILYYLQLMTLKAQHLHIRERINFRVMRHRVIQGSFLNQDKNTSQCVLCSQLEVSFKRMKTNVPQISDTFDSLLYFPA
jgi:hypothetical protein